MKKINRPNCVISGSSNYNTLYKFKEFPVNMGCTDKPIENDIKEEMEWVHFPESDMIQLLKPLPLDVVYSEFHNSGCVGKLWEEHHREFAKFIYESSPENILEIGGGHGILSLEYNKLSNIEWTIIEPNPTPAEGVKANFIKGFFDEKFSSQKKYSTIVHSHVFEHVYNPIKFVSDISKYFDEGDTLIFSVPNMDEMLKRKFTNILNFEHTYLLNKDVIEYLLKMHNFEIDKIKKFKEDHSVFYSARKSNKNNSTALNLKQNINKILFEEYIEYHLSLVKELNFKKENSSKKIFLFGAHVFSQYLIAFGLDTKNIIYVLDNDAQKQDKRLYGTNLSVKSPKILKNYNSPTVILKAGVFNEEIKQDIIENINPNTRFI